MFRKTIVVTAVAAGCMAMGVGPALAAQVATSNPYVSSLRVYAEGTAYTDPGTANTWRLDVDLLWQQPNSGPWTFVSRWSSVTYSGQRTINGRASQSCRGSISSNYRTTTRLYKNGGLDQVYSLDRVVACTH